MGRDRNDRTYRVSRLPSYITLGGVSAYLGHHLDENVENIQTFSLATSLEHSGSSKVATIKFLKTPTRFDNDLVEWPITVPGLENNLVFDVHFLGLTPFNDVADGDHISTCVEDWILLANIIGVLLFLA
jgi:hypothetical protein